MPCGDFLCSFVSGTEAYMADFAGSHHQFGDVGKWRGCVCAVRWNLLVQYASLLLFSRSVTAISGALE